MAPTRVGISVRTTGREARQYFRLRRPTTLVSLSPWSSRRKLHTGDVAKVLGFASTLLYGLFIAATVRAADIAENLALSSNGDDARRHEA